jgi:hypothetical protein
VKSNPGGQLDTESIRGRDALVAQMWGILEGRSIYMNDLRRVGKTMILRKMQAEPPAGWIAIKRDLGGFHSAAEFATGVFRDSEGALGRKKLALRRMGQLLGNLQGTEIAGVLKLPGGAVAPWKEILTRTFSDLEDELAAENSRVVFLWDEVPFLLDNVAKREAEGSLVAMEILDLLRSLSQDYSRVRMVLTGSVGLHHILSSLQKRGYLNSPLNHMERISPGALAPEDARELAGDLLRGDGIVCADLETCANSIASSVGNVAFYVHKLISRLPRHPPLTPAAIETRLQAELAHPDNDWDLAHYRTRLLEYYGTDAPIVLLALDAVAVGEPLDFEGILREVRNRASFDDVERLRQLLRFLQQDHYLERDPVSGHYRFRFPLIRRWWRFDRNL